VPYGSWVSLLSVQRKSAAVDFALTLLINKIRTDRLHTRNKSHLHISRDDLRYLICIIFQAMMSPELPLSDFGLLSKTTHKLFG